MRRFLLAAVAVAAATAVLAIVAGSARGQVSAVPAPALTAVSNHDGPDFSVEALTLGSGNVLYIGGWFDRLAKPTGHSVRFNGSGIRDTAWPEVDGPVRAIADDGAGGWYLGGEFTHVARQPRAGLAHVRAGGELDPAWAPALDAPDAVPDYRASVTALAVVRDTLYVGGYFTAIDGQLREGLAALDTVGGHVRPWNPRPNRPARNRAPRRGGVHALAAASGTIYVGGGFTRIGSEARHGVAAFDAATGALRPWDPRLAPDTDVEVNALVIDGGTLYVGGDFEASSGHRRSRLAAFDAATGALTAWNPGIENYGRVTVLAVAGDTVYVGGEFASVGRAERAGLAAVDARAGRVLPWRADVKADEGMATVEALAVVGDRLYVGGRFGSIAGQRRTNLAALSTGSGLLSSWAPALNSTVSSLAASGGAVLAGGAFSGLDPLTRNGGTTAIDLHTGTVLPFHPYPSPTGAHIHALAAQAGSVFVAGGLGVTGGRHYSVLAKLNKQNGRAQRWDARVRSRYPCCAVDALAVRGRTLYVGGYFSRIGGQRRRNLAAVKTGTGRATSWRMDTDGEVEGLLINGHRLYVTGAFTRLGGHRRRHVAAIDLRSGRLTPWSPDPDGRVHALAISGGRVYLGGRFRHVRGRTRSNLAAVTATGGTLQPWQPRANAPVHALAVIAGTVYAGGDFTAISGTPRQHLAALFAASGAPTDWNPGTNHEVSQLLATPAGLVAGGQFTSLGGSSHTGLGIFPLSESTR